MPEYGAAGRANYFPNSTGNGSPNVAPPSAGGYVPYAENVQGQKVRGRSDSFKDYFSQATLFWNSLSDPEKQHLAQAAHFELGKVETKAIRQRMVDLLANVDRDLAVQVAAGIGIAGPSDAVRAVARDAMAPPEGRRSIDRCRRLVWRTPRRGRLGAVRSPFSWRMAWTRRPFSQPELRSKGWPSLLKWSPRRWAASRARVVRTFRLTGASSPLAGVAQRRRRFRRGNSDPSGNASMSLGQSSGMHPLLPCL